MTDEAQTVEGEAPADPKTNGEEKKGRTARKARRAMSEATQRGDIKAAKAIGKTFLDLEAQKEIIKGERAKWKDRIGAAEATMRGAVSSDDDGTPQGARSKLNAIVLSFQEVDEAAAGRKAALHLLIEERKEINARLRKQVEGARQLGLFDD